MSRRESVLRALEGMLLFGLYAIPLTVAWTVAGVHIAAGIAAAAALGLLLVARRAPLAPTPADAAMIAFAIATLVSIAAAQERGASFVGAKKLLLLPILQLAAGGLARWRGVTALRLFVAGITATALVAIVVFVATPHATDARLRSTGHYMTLAGLLGLAWPLAVGAACTSRGRARYAYAAAALVLTLGLGLGFTRGAWLGCLVGLGAMLLRARPRLAWLAPVAAALVVVVAPPAYRERALSSFDPSHPTNVERTELWRAGLAVWRAHPLVGVGPVDLEPALRPHLPSSARRVHGHLHDNWLHIAATLGLLGLLAFGWLMVGFGRAAWQAGRAAAPPEARGLGAGIWGAFWVFQVMGLFEWNFGDVEVTIAICFLLGAGLAAARHGAVDSRSSAGRAGPVMSD